MEFIDMLIYVQLIIGRLGEKEAMGWWNTDIAHRLGGAKFLTAITNSRVAPLAAAEGLLLAAQMKESGLLLDASCDSAFSLFCPPPEITRFIKQRLMHYKKYEDDIPADIIELMKFEHDWSNDELLSLLKKQASSMDYMIEGTVAGLEVRPKEAKAFTSCEDALLCCAAVYCTLGKNAFKLIYVREICNE